jgi:hypothetical protein
MKKKKKNMSKNTSINIITTHHGTPMRIQLTTQGKTEGLMYRHKKKSLHYGVSVMGTAPLAIGDNGGLEKSPQIKFAFFFFGFEFLQGEGVKKRCYTKRHMAHQISTLLYVWEVR